MATKAGKQAELQVTDDDAPERARRRPPTWAVILSVVLVAAVLVAGGVLLANWLNQRGEPTPVERTADVQALQALVVATSQAEQLLGRGSQIDVTDSQAVQSLGIQLQRAAVAIGDAVAQANDEELQGIAADLSDAYLNIGVGLVTDSAQRTQRGVQALPDAQAAISQYLGIEPSPAPSPSATTSPAPSPSPTPSQ